MRQCRIVLDAFQLVGDNLFHVGLNPVVVLLNLLLHAVVAWKTRARVTPAPIWI